MNDTSWTEMDLAALEGRMSEVESELAPVTGEPAEHMRRQIRRAAREAHYNPRQFVNDGLAKMPHLIKIYRGVPDDHVAPDLIPFSTVADILVALVDLRVRDDAWARMNPEHAEAHAHLWRHLTQLAPPGGFIAPPASLLAFVAWQQGDRPLAYAAVSRALADNPEYSMAQLLLKTFDSGAPPSMARLPMSPEAVAESYDEKEGK